MKKDEPTREELIAENKIFRERLLEAEQTFKAIRNGEVDALVIRESGEEADFYTQRCRSRIPYSRGIHK